MDDHRELQHLLRLTAWLSPSFPIGSFAYSGGLERAVHDRLVSDAASLAGWIRLLMSRGALWNDVVLFSESHRCQADAGQLESVAELAEALSGSRERHQEQMLLGEAFLSAARAWPDAVFERLPAKVAYPVAVGAVTGASGIGAAKAIAVFLQAYASQMVSSGIRLSVAGQKEGTAILAELESFIGSVAEKAASSSLDDLGSATIQADIAALRHEVQQTRLFRS